VLTATYVQVRELYFQNPQFGFYFYFLRLTSERLFENIERLEQELSQRNTETAALQADGLARGGRVRLHPHEFRPSQTSFL
jgi:hypothetical protein